MKFDVYGRFRLEVERENDSWRMYRRELGERVKVNDLVIPNTFFKLEEIAGFFGRHLS